VEKAVWYMVFVTMVLLASILLIAWMPVSLAAGLWMFVPLVVTRYGLQLHDRLTAREITKHSDLDAELENLLNQK
jgi:hypothetical protein